MGVKGTRASVLRQYRLLSTQYRNKRCCRNSLTPVFCFLFLFFTFHSTLFTPLNAQVSRPTGISSRVNRDFRPTSLPQNKKFPSSKKDTDVVANDSTMHGDSTQIKGLVYHKAVPDSVLRDMVFFFYLRPFNVKFNEVWNPSLDPSGVQYNNEPLDGFNGNYYLGKGVAGHPHLPIYYRRPDRLKINFQQEEFEGYIKTPDNVRYFQTLTPYSLVSYNNSLNKDYLVHLTHTQNIIPGWNVAFDYQLICPEGPFAYSGTKNHYLDATTNYFSTDSRIMAHGGIIWQSFTIDENGGIIDDSHFISGEMSNQSGLPMALSGTGSTHLRRNAFASVSYNMVRQVERIRLRDSLATRIDTSSDGTENIIVDTIEVTDTLRTSKPTSFNAGIFTLDASYSRRERTAYMTTFSNTEQWDESSATLFWTNDAYPDHKWHNPFKITLGVTPRKISGIIHTDTSRAPDTVSAISIFNPFVRTELLLGKLLFKVEAELDQTLTKLNTAVTEPDYRGSASLLFLLDTMRLSGIEGTTRFISSMPDVRMLHASSYSLSPLRELYLGAHFFKETDSKNFKHLIDINLSATNKSHAVWYDTLLRVHEGNGNFWIFQADINLRFQWHWLHFDMQQQLQYSTDSVQMPLPLWASKNSLYADFLLFSGALRLQIGTDLRFYTAFAPQQYDPATGVFFRQETKTGNYLWADAFLNLQVKRVSIYLKGGHINALWEKHPNYFLLPHYPGQSFGLFWGITWHFFD